MSRQNIREFKKTTTATATGTPLNKRFNELARVVQRLENAIHRINHYPANSVVCFVNTYPLDIDLSGG